MKRILSIDATSPWGGVALVQSDESDGSRPEVLAEAGFLVRDHACHLLGWMDAVLERAAVSKDSIDLFVGTRGPGSFTGLRVGLGTVRGLAVATGKPCVGVGTLEAMAEAFGPAEAPRVPLLIAGRREVYGARYDATSSPPVELGAPMVGPLGLVLETLGGGEPAVIFGSGVETVVETLPAGVRVGMRPRGVAAAAASLALRSESTADSMSPIYVRPPDATPQR